MPLKIPRNIHLLIQWSGILLQVSWHISRPGGALRCENNWKETSDLGTINLISKREEDEGKWVSHVPSEDWRLQRQWHIWTSIAFRSFHRWGLCSLISVTGTQKSHLPFLSVLPILDQVMGRKEAERTQASVNQLGRPQHHFIVYLIRNKVESESANPNQKRSRERQRYAWKAVHLTQNRIITGWYGLGGTLWIMDHLLPTSLPWAETLSTRTHCSKPRPTWPWTLPGRGIHNFSGQPFPVTHHSHTEEFIPYT